MWKEMKNGKERESPLLITHVNIANTFNPQFTHFARTNRFPFSNRFDKF